MLAMLPKTRAANLDMLSNFRSRFFVLTVVIVDELFRNFNANKAMKTFSFEKNVTLPHLAVLHENLQVDCRKSDETRFCCNLRKLF
jgi:hypothetical protein